MGSNHYVTEDDWYEGYFIPKNSIIMINQWAIHYNEDDFPDPSKVTCLSFSPKLSRSMTLRDTFTTNLLPGNLQLFLMLKNEITLVLEVEGESAQVLLL